MKIDTYNRMYMDPRGGGGVTPARRHLNPHLEGGWWGVKAHIPHPHRAGGGTTYDTRSSRNPLTSVVSRKVSVAAS